MGVDRKMNLIMIFMSNLDLSLSDVLGPAIILKIDKQIQFLWPK